MLLKDDEDTSKELATDGTDDGSMVYALFALGLVVSAKFRIIANGYGGGQPESVAQIR